MGYGSILNQSFETSPVLDDYFTKDETLTSNTAALYGLSRSAVPDDVLAKARTLINDLESSFNSEINAVAVRSAWSMIGTADLSGMDASSAISINLTQNISNLTELAIMVDGFKDTSMNAGGWSLKITQPSLTNTPTFYSDKSANLRGGSGYIFFFNLSDSENISGYPAFVCVKTPSASSSAYNYEDVIYSSLSPTATISVALSTNIGNGQTVQSGTIKVYGKVKP